MPYELMISLGSILLLSLAADWVGRNSGLPRVTLLLLLGLFVGRNGLDILPAATVALTEIVAPLALSMVAFLLGGEMARDRISALGREILILSSMIVCITCLFVFAGLIALGMPVVLALILAAISTSTAPAATREVIDEIKAKGRYCSLVLGIVAIDDAWGLIIFGFAIAIASSLLGANDATALEFLIRHLGGAVLIGITVGVSAAYLTGRLEEGRPSQLEALGVVFLSCGLSLWLEASYLLAATITGVFVANFAKHHDYAFRELEHFEWPFLTVFFVLAGASLDFTLLMSAGFAGLGYIALRMVGRVVGGWLGGTLANLPTQQRLWVGSALMPQAGVAIGMGLIASQQFPAFGETILAVTIGGTVVFELIGPILTKTSFKRVGMGTTSDRP